MFEKKKINENLLEIEKKLENQNIWNKFEEMSQELKKKNYFIKFLDSFKKFEQNYLDTIELIKLSKNNNDDELITELENELIVTESNLNLLYLETLMSGKADSKNALIEIHAGAGGVESQDWAEMLLRMYSRWAESKNFKVELIDQSIGDEAGIKSVTIRISGQNSYGWLKLESGVHRLVRISPFDSQSRRHTSFASVSCYPEIDNSVNIIISDKDIRIDTFRASGAGGQHVNKTDSAVRITHLPSNVVASCQEEKSQHKNKAKAMKMLASRLYEKTKSENEEKIANKRKSMVGSGDRSEKIRSYNYPQGRVTDHRINLTLYKLEDITSGLALNEIIEPLLAADLEEKIKSL